ncbi:acyltransferase [Williamsia phyllosphaerae]|uniref:acyltransferase n=1 Tax=Williamsia phyllosphaerae TaxID=885042 RepID=UPI00166BD754|nr:acyltransferase [Williamsia phyllosphaerae]
MLTATGASSPTTTSLATSSATGVSTSAPATTRRGHLHQLDFVRGSTFLLVIFCHVLSNTNNSDTSVLANALGMWGHFTRNAFFFLTGFVLMFGNYDKTDFRATQFWPRRLKLVVIPYLIWSVVYWGYSVVANGGWSEMGFWFEQLRNGLIWGTAGFQLYFIFVIIQFYLLFPVILWIVRKTRNHHVTLLVASLIIQLAVLYTLNHLSAPQGSWLYENWWHAYSTFLPYQFFVFLGAVAAVHRDRVDEWLRGRGWWILAGVIAGGVFAYVTFSERLADGQPPALAGFALNPTLQPFIFMAIVALYATALRWSDRRDRTPRFNKVVAYASNRSFAIFLAHVFVLQLLILPRLNSPETQGWFEQHLGAPWATIVVYLLTVSITLVIAEGLRRAPFALYLTGRPRIPVRAKRTTGSSVTSDTSRQVEPTRG